MDVDDNTGTDGLEDFVAPLVVNDRGLIHHSYALQQVLVELLDMMGFPIVVVAADVLDRRSVAAAADVEKMAERHVGS